MARSCKDVVFLNTAKLKKKVEAISKEEIRADLLLLCVCVCVSSEGEWSGGGV